MAFHPGSLNSSPARPFTPATEAATSQCGRSRTTHAAHTRFPSAPGAPQRAGATCKCRSVNPEERFLAEGNVDWSINSSVLRLCRPTVGTNQTSYLCVDFPAYFLFHCPQSHSWPLPGSLPWWRTGMQALVSGFALERKPGQNTVYRRKILAEFCCWRKI